MILGLKVVSRGSDVEGPMLQPAAPAYLTASSALWSAIIDCAMYCLVSPRPRASAAFAREALCRCSPPSALALAGRVQRRAGLCVAEAIGSDPRVLKLTRRTLRSPAVGDEWKRPRRASGAQQRNRIPRINSICYAASEKLRPGCVVCATTGLGPTYYGGADPGRILRLLRWTGWVGTPRVTRR